MTFRRGSSQKWMSSRSNYSYKNYFLVPEPKRVVKRLPLKLEESQPIKFEGFNKEFKHYVAVTSAALISQNTVWAGLEQLVNITPDSFGKSRFWNTLGTLAITYLYSKYRDTRHKKWHVDRSHNRGLRVAFDAATVSIAHGAIAFTGYSFFGVEGWKLWTLTGISAGLGLPYGLILGEMMDTGKYIMNVIDEQYAPRWAVKYIKKPSLSKQIAYVSLAALVTAGSFSLANYQKSFVEDSVSQKKIINSKESSSKDKLPSSTINWSDVWRK